MMIKIFVCFGFDLLLSAVVAANLYYLWFLMTISLMLPYVFLLSHHTRQYLVCISVFLSLVGEVGGVKGRGLKISHAHTVSATASRKDTQIALLLSSLLLLLLLLT